MYPVLSYISRARSGDHVAANIRTQVRFVTKDLCRRGMMIAIARSRVRGRRANIPEFTRVFKKIV